MYKPSYKFAILDMDGTLIDSNGMHRTAVTQYFRNYGKQKFADNMQEHFYRTPLGRAVEEAKAYCKEYNIPMISKEAVDKIIRDGYKKVEKKPGAKEFLEILKQNDVRMCIVTATGQALAQEALELAGLDEFIEFILSAEQFSRGKGHRDIFDEALRMFHAAPEETALIDDSLYSLKTGKLVGLRTIAVEDELHSRCKEEIKSMADEYFERFPI